MTDPGLTNIIVKADGDEYVNAPIAKLNEFYRRFGFALLDTGDAVSGLPYAAYIPDHSGQITDGLNVQQNLEVTLTSTAGGQVWAAIETLENLKA